MNVLDELHRRPLPTFDQWLEDKGNGEHGDGFEAFRDLAERTHAQQPIGTLTRQETAFLRFWMGFQIAVTELCNIEHQQGQKTHEIIQTMPRVLGAAAIYAIASVLKDNAPLRDFAKVLTEEFRFAVKEGADQIEVSRLPCLSG